ncbi:unnamed protein product [Rotaria sp. Silwood2]|nr:unnamed protein product [Rotaria sp. Silwood2]CAF2641578.1 unnamed protein product [Rotaria sp. Silwood2]CAF3854657.1 unnamed protein product [Rotaria sp. Silwood2]CAF4272795.1 unnamed protein product [Rotaria sp. Silwood2]
MNMEIEKLDIDSIFVKYTINEIRDIEEKIKLDMERKKEELRSMVGERYRDLIEAADAIFEMKTCAKGVEQFVHLLNDKCGKIDRTLLTQSTSSNTISDKQLSKLTLVLSVKILTETRRRCWMYLEENNFAAAARQYLLAQHMASSLSSSTTDEPLDSDSQKAIVAATRLWNQTRHMKATILDKCRLYLKSIDTNVQVLANALSTLISFGNKSVEQALNEFLTAKLDIIKESYENADLKQSSKNTVRQLLVLFINTIFELDMLFSKNDKNTDKCDQLKKYILTFNNTSNDDDNSQVNNILSYGQQHLLNIQETFFKNCEPIDLIEYESRQQQLVQNAVEKWLQTALQVVKSGMSELLNHVTSLKLLLRLKSSLVSLMTEERMEQWATVCNRLLNGKDKDIRLWDDLIKIELRTRAKQVLHVRFDQFNQTAIQKIEQCLKAFQNSTNKNDKSFLEFSALNYIWSHLDNNIPSDYVWTPSTHRIPVGDAKFSLKAVAISMDVQNLCRELDDELRQILDDVNEFSVADVTPVSSLSDTLLSTTNTNNNSSIYSDSGFVEEHLEECVIQFCTTLLARLRQIAHDNEKIGNEEQTLASLVWLGSCARAIPIVCKNLKNSLELVINVTDMGNSPVHDRKGRGTSQSKRTLDKTEKTSWLKTRDMFMTTHIDLFKQWIIHICAKIDMLLRNKLSTFLDDIPILIWDEIEIEESLDTDKTYKSVIRVPMYCTPFIEELLFYSCQEINQALAHGLDKELSSEMAYRILQTFLNVYESWWLTEGQKRISKKRIQTRIIQIVYDLRFVHMLLERKDNSSNTKDLNESFFKLIENIESEIDPFDLNVLSPYMQSHLQKIVPRSSLLFGHLITNDRIIPSKPLTMNSQDTNNILSLSSCSQRFSLLPIATNLSSTSSGQKRSSKGNMLKSNIIHEQEHNNNNIGNDSSLASFRPLTTNVAEVATYYSKWFQNIVK